MERMAVSADSREGKRVKVVRVRRLNTAGNGLLDDMEGTKEEGMKE